MIALHRESGAVARPAPAPSHASRRPLYLVIAVLAAALLWLTRSHYDCTTRTVPAGTVRECFVVDRWTGHVEVRRIPAPR